MIIRSERESGRSGGSYLLNISCNDLSAEDIWRNYNLLTRVEAAPNGTCPPWFKERPKKVWLPFCSSSEKRERWHLGDPKLKVSLEGLFG